MFVCLISDYNHNLMRYFLILLILTLGCIVNSQTPPALPSQFQIDFNETAKLITSGTTKGTIYYDFKNNRQVVTR